MLSPFLVVRLQLLLTNGPASTCSVPARATPSAAPAGLGSPVCSPGSLEQQVGSFLRVWGLNQAETEQRAVSRCSPKCLFSIAHAFKHTGSRRSLGNCRSPSHQLWTPVGSLLLSHLVTARGGRTLISFALHRAEQTFGCYLNNNSFTLFLPQENSSP